MADELSYEKSQALYDRAKRVLSLSCYQSAAPRPLSIVRGVACWVWDADGNSYIDYTCGNGTMLLGYGHPLNPTKPPEGSPMKSPADLRVVLPENSNIHSWDHLPAWEHLPGPSPRLVNLAELLVPTISGMAWASFTNSGNNAIDAAVALARLHSGRSLILIPENSYQHEYSFCLDTQKGLLWGGERLLTFPYGNEQILEELFRRHRGKIAGVLLPPYFQPGTDHSSMPHGTWYTKVEQLCHQEGALFIMDDLRTTMRMSLHGSHAYFGAQPDLICLGEALANGRPIGALLGVRQLRDSANTLPASFSYGISPASITAAEQTMEFLTKENHMEQLQMKGQTFRRGLQETATQAGLPLNITGPPAIPSIRLAGDPGGKFSGVVSAQLIAHGVYLDLTRGIYLSLGHSEADIQLTMERAARGFSAAKKILAN